eukprot:6439997-Prorocentrum_lima.AAC.1
MQCPVGGRLIQRHNNIREWLSTTCWDVLGLTATTEVPHAPLPSGPRAHHRPSGASAPSDSPDWTCQWPRV